MSLTHQQVYAKWHSKSHCLPKQQGSPKHEEDSDGGPRNGLSQHPPPFPGTKQKPLPEGQPGKRLPVATQPSLSVLQPGTGHVMSQLPHPSANSSVPTHLNHSTGRNWGQPSAGVRWSRYLGNSKRDRNHSYGQECASLQSFMGQPSRLDASQSSLGKWGGGLGGAAKLGIISLCCTSCSQDCSLQGSPFGKAQGLSPDEKRTADRSSIQWQPLGSTVLAAPRDALAQSLGRTAAVPALIQCHSAATPSSLTTSPSASLTSWTNIR